MGAIRRAATSLALMGLVVGCSISADVYGIVGDESEVFTGVATGYADRTGTIKLANTRGTDCIGQFRYTGMSTGVGLLSCNDGQRATIQFHALGMASGYGFGVSDRGRPVKFTYGLTREESAKYIGPQSAAASPPAAGTPPAATPGQPQAIGSGSGFFISRQGHVLTNAHVTEKCTSVTVQRPGAPAEPATVVRQDRENDVAVILASTPAPAVATFRAGRPIRLGETVVAFGFPLSGLLASGGVLTTGSVNALTGLRDDTRYLQISAPIQPGNSGGPVMDSSGLVIGISTGSLPSVRRTIVQNANFAVKNEVVSTFLSVAGIGIETAAGGRELAVADVGDRARAFTVRVECRR